MHAHNRPRCFPLTGISPPNPRGMLSLIVAVARTRRWGAASLTLFGMPVAEMLQSPSAANAGERNLRRLPWSKHEPREKIHASRPHVRWRTRMAASLRNREVAQGETLGPAAPAAEKGQTSRLEVPPALYASAHPRAKKHAVASIEPGLTVERRIIVDNGNDGVRHQALRVHGPRNRIIVNSIPLAGRNLPATCRLVADFSRTRFDRWGASTSYGSLGFSLSEST
jgi:hypothetical protein